MQRPWFGRPPFFPGDDAGGGFCGPFPRFQPPAGPHFPHQMGPDFDQRFPHRPSFAPRFANRPNSPYRFHQPHHQARQHRWRGPRPGQASVSGGHSGGEARGYYQPSMMENPWAPLQTEDQKAEEKWLQWRESHVQPNLSFSVPP